MQLTRLIMECALLKKIIYAAFFSLSTLRQLRKVAKSLKSNKEQREITLIFNLMMRTWKIIFRAIVFITLFFRKNYFLEIVNFLSSNSGGLLQRGSGKV